MGSSEALGTLRIDRRFCGPPDSGNGGYVAGRLAAFVDGPAVVRLHSPPPLERALVVRRSADGADSVELLDADVRVATARPTRLDVAPLPTPTLAEARAAEPRFRAWEDHPFAGCFVCGTERNERDGLRIFAGPLEPGDAGSSAVACTVACSWTPDDTLAAPGDPEHVAPEFVWAALDCPGVFAYPQVDGVSLLGELAVAIDALPAIGEPAILVGREDAHEGRKHRTATAMYAENGRRLAVATATWIALPGVHY